jgi:hypothetical protein
MSILFKDVPEGSLFYFRGGTFLKLVEKGTSSNVVVVEKRPGGTKAGRLTEFFDNSEVSLEKPEEWVEVSREDVKPGMLFKYEPSSSQTLVRVDSLKSTFPAGSEVWSLCIGSGFWLQATPLQPTVFVLKELVS